MFIVNSPARDTCEILAVISSLGLVFAVFHLVAVHVDRRYPDDQYREIFALYENADLPLPSSEFRWNLIWAGIRVYRTPFSYSLHHACRHGIVHDHDDNASSQFALAAKIRARRIGILLLPTSKNKVFVELSSSVSERAISRQLTTETRPTSENGSPGHESRL